MVRLVTQPHRNLPHRTTGGACEVGNVSAVAAARAQAFISAARGKAWRRITDGCSR